MNIADQIAHMVMEQTADIRAERDTYRCQRDELVEATRELVRQHMNVRAAEGYPDAHSEASLVASEIIDRIEQEDANP